MVEAALEGYQVGPMSQSEYDKCLANGVLRNIVLFGTRTPAATWFAEGSRSCPHKPEDYSDSQRNLDRKIFRELRMYELSDACRKKFGRGWHEV